MRRHEANDEITVYVVDASEKLRKACFTAKVIAVGVDVLTEEHYLLVAVLDESLDLADYILGTAAALFAAYIWDNAVGAEVIAAKHYRHGRLERALANLFKALADLGVFSRIGSKPCALHALEYE